MPQRRFCITLAMLFMLAAPARAAEPPAPPATLAELARAADLVALARVSDTDYRLQRGLPVSGSAWLEVLIRYRGEAPDRRIEVYEQGLHPGECYFEAPAIGEDGARFLVFLREDPGQAGRYRGLQAGCAIDVLVDADNRYSVRLPVTGMRLVDDLSGLARPVTFADRHAVVSDEDLPPAERNAMRDGGYIEPLDGGRSWRYTRGVGLAEFRRLMEVAAEP